MNEEIDPAETLSQLGYAAKSGGKWKAAAIVLLLLFIAALGSAIFMAKRWSDAQSKTLSMERQLKEATTRLSTAEAKSAELSSLLADKQAENERLREEWASQVKTLTTEHDAQLQRTYGQMNEIVYDSRKTLAYIGDIETRLRKGQKIDQTEAVKLKNVISGLSFLYEQYKKPMSQFRELDHYISRQLASIPDESKVDPKETTPPLQRIFKNKQFKEAQATYHKTQGKTETLLQAKSQVQAAYSRAQAQMSSLNFDKNKYLTELDNMVKSNEASAQEVEDFFENSKEILKIHDKIMNLKPTEQPDVKP